MKAMIIAILFALITITSTNEIVVFEFDTETNSFQQVFSSNKTLDTHPPNETTNPCRYELFVFPRYIAYISLDSTFSEYYYILFGILVESLLEDFK